MEVLQALDTVLAAQGITTVYLGTQYVKVVSAKQAPLEPAPVIELRPHQLPDSSSYLIYVVKLNNVTFTKAMPALQACSSGLANSIIGIGPGGRRGPPSKDPLEQLASRVFPGQDNTYLILRDYSSNVRRMLQVLEKMEQE